MRWRRLFAGAAIAAFGLSGPALARAAPDPVTRPVDLPPGARSAAAGPAAADAAATAYTVDPALEERVRSLLRGREVALGHVILMDPESGDVLAYVSTDPERFPATRAYPTASLMKVVTSAALLRVAPAAAGRECRYQGSPYRLLPTQLVPPTRGGRRETFRRALAISNNQCFARMAAFDVGQEQLLAEMRSLGLLEAPAPGHDPGRVAPLEDPLSVGRLGSGLAGSFITPLAAARLASTLAHGRLVTPRWLAATGATRAAAVSRTVWPEERAEQLRGLLEDVTVDGTARRGFRDANGRPLLGDVRVAGKTGTLSGRNPAGLYQWFVGVAPADAPRIAIATVVVDGPSSASTLSAQVLREVFCGAAGCTPDRIEPLMARVRARHDAVAPAEPPAPQEPRVVELSEEELIALRGLDQPPRPIGIGRLDLPRPLLRKPAHGEIVLRLELNPEGEVLAAIIDSSDLPDFNEFVLSEVRGWRFTPPTMHGHPVFATARLALPIRVN